ncbi:hypothetical protein [Schleiferilactobacillus harbinensis]|uniref:hypothetical protein n=1 Tax=Schleiferilactobacillus harbinensis TaxID=304207 RepID=UPI0039E946CF
MKNNETQVIFDINEEYCFEVKHSAYPQLWSDSEGNVFKETKRGGLFSLRTSIDNDGYEIVSTTNHDGNPITIPVQRVVATAWLQNPQHLTNVCNIDGDPLNNKADNLQWTSHQDYYFEFAQVEELQEGEK